MHISFSMDPSINSMDLSLLTIKARFIPLSPSPASMIEFVPEVPNGMLSKSTSGQSPIDGRNAFKCLEFSEQSDVANVAIHADSDCEFSAKDGRNEMLYSFDC
jgi:hypothetical protein